MDDLFRSIHFRQYFYLISIITLLLLFVIKYKVLPVINRRETQRKKTLRFFLDTLITLIIAALVISGLIFWLYGNA
ncbi:hypothetical protein DYU05_00180 [Mucilaginibacter terrenus]|uniref:Uncharacterized protein n=1 Tax=Mucilaginibacter terrenus TaxID=2482727 RepID=A0A3E2NSV2_9SPHI|nr:hypothetical protein DYU05_00180 [Mucilaginibacter terrenus]